jgi:hypothetical protein
MYNILGKIWDKFTKIKINTKFKMMAFSFEIVSKI